ncbi:MAG TPA: hypothetical protein VL913_00240 [Candidatus Micrarchaeaceae archaeon]|nr:hypothetical protein [Candidatus Micrarchaeaceae archaeon]
MTCPQCNERVPFSALFKATHVSGVVCPKCQASLSPGAVCTIVLTILAFGAGEIALLLLKRFTGEIWLAIVGFVLAAAIVYAVLGPMMMRLRLKHPGEPHLKGHSA